MTKFLAAIEEHFQRFPNERAAIECFADLFDVRWAHHERFERSDASFYLLKPRALAAELYGIEREVLLLYSPYDALEADWIAVNSFFHW